MTSKTADVCVVGAGPAGLSAAMDLVRAGARVILLERHSRPGGKACAGGLTARAWEPAGIDPGAAPRWARTYDTLEVHAPAGRITMDAGRPLLAVADRRRWIADRLEELCCLGCDVRLGERLIGLRRGEASTSRSPSVRFGKLVGADGAASRVRRLLRIEPGPRIRARQLVAPADRGRAREIAARGPAVWFDPARFGAGYGWAFPSPTEIRIGCGASPETLGARGLGRAFLDWLDRLGLSPSDGRVEAGTIGCGYVGHRFGDVLLAGDAAGTASPLTGEGIAEALISGREIAREIADGGYRSAIVPALSRRHRRTRDFLAHSPFGGILYRLSPALLRVPGIRKEALARYVS